MQFLDPRTKDVDAALENLERYVVVGLQADLDETLSRWANVTLRSCRDHPRFGAMESLLRAKTEELQARGVTRWRESVTKVNSSRSDEENYDVDIDEGTESLEIEFVAPDVRSFDRDLQEWIGKFTAGDEVIYKRVLELYERQKHWAL